MIGPNIRREHPLCKLAVDLCCGAGGMSMGLWQAGFEIIGVDINPQPNYPFQFIQADALDIDPDWLGQTADIVSLAPPCQFYSVMRYMWSGNGEFHPALIEPLRSLALQSGLPYILENVEGARAHLHHPVQLCGSGTSLRVQRHRLIESNIPLVGLDCDHGWQNSLPCYRVRVGRGRVAKGYKNTGVMPVFGSRLLESGDELYEASVAMGINWMTKPELNEAIPPAYGFHLGKQLMQYVLAHPKPYAELEQRIV